MIVTPDLVVLFYINIFVGFSACGLLWIFSTPEGRKTVSWRILFCTILAASITPTKYPFFDSWFPVPAAEMIISKLFDGSQEVNLFFSGVIPIAAVSFILFVILTLWQSRK